MPPDAAAVSVIIPAYRAVATIGRALDSIAAQTVKPAEVIVVDDGSDDGTYEAAMAKSGLFGDLGFKVIKQDNAGAGAARNRALKEATQKYVAFLDADDEWLPQKLDRSFEHLEAGSLVLVAHNAWLMADGTETLLDCARRFREHPDPFVGLYRKGYIATSTVVADRQAVLEAGGFDEGLPNGQDFVLWLCLLRQPEASFEVFDQALSRYHVTPDGITSHTWRRLRCVLEIAVRFAPDLKSRPGPALMNVLYRGLAVHFEALSALKGRGDFLGVLGICLHLPFSLIVLSARVLLC